jgi:hypothetical protein
MFTTACYSYQSALVHNMQLSFVMTNTNDTKYSISINNEHLHVFDIISFQMSNV